jgi:hypothetical protein
MMPLNSLMGGRMPVSNPILARPMPGSGFPIQNPVIQRPMPGGPTGMPGSGMPIQNPIAYRPMPTGPTAMPGGGGFQGFAGMMGAPHLFGGQQMPLRALMG